jgi:hypothetical protein
MRTLSGPPAMPTVRHPLILAIWPAHDPTAPAAVETATVSPALGWPISSKARFGRGRRSCQRGPSPGPSLLSASRAGMIWSRLAWTRRRFSARRFARPLPDVDPQGRNQDHHPDAQPRPARAVPSPVRQHPAPARADQRTRDALSPSRRASRRMDSTLRQPRPLQQLQQRHPYR